MTKTKTYITYLLTAIWLWTGFACSRNDVEDVSFNAWIEGGTNTFKAGQQVNFQFRGDVDYLTFFSGEEGADYDHIFRTESEMKSLELSCTFKQQYNDVDYWGKEIMQVAISTDFTGDYTTEALRQATWMPISGNEYNRLPVPTPLSASAVETTGSIDLSSFVAANCPFYVAFIYHAPGRATIPAANGNNHYINRPRIDVSNLMLKKVTAGGQVIEMTDAIREWAFRPVFLQSATQTNYQVNDNGLLFQPQKATADSSGREPDEEVWMVSQLIRPSQVDSDRGTPIQSVEARVSSYSYTYRNPGTYKATFVATNANMWNSASSVRQLTVIVKEP